MSFAACGLTVTSRFCTTFSETDPTTGANKDGATPDYSVVLDEDNNLIGIVDYGRNGSSSGIANSGGNAVRLKLDD